MTPIRFIEDTGSYAHRTRANAQWADLTVAIAVDLNTSGEQLTRDSAGDRYLGLTIPNGLRIGEDRLVKTAIAHGIKTADWINENVINPDGVKISIAGNGMRTLANNGISQETVDYFMGIFVKALYDKLDAYDFPIMEVRSGGQTGIDEAAIKAKMEETVRSLGEKTEAIGSQAEDLAKAAAIDHAAALTLKKEYIMPTLRKEYKLAE